MSVISYMPPDLASALEPWLEPAEFPGNSTIFVEGGEVDGCYFIESGQVRIERRDDDIDSEPVIAQLGPGEVLGELGLLDGRPRAASAVAGSQAVKARMLKIETLAEIGEKDPGLEAKIYRHLGREAATKLRAANEPPALEESDDLEVGKLVADAQAAQAEFEKWPEEKVDALLQTIAETTAARAEELAELAVKVTRYGNIPDKATKNRMASMGVLLSLAGRPGSGLLAVDPETGVSQIAAPVGVVFAMIPVTNPVATAVFKTLICLKSRNALILSFHRSARDVATVVGEMLTGILKKAGAPAGLVSWVKDRNSRRKTDMFFRHPGISLILATGGRAMVRAAYGSGKPALGVGPGNAPCLVCADCDLATAAGHVVLSKSFDNGLICGGEHNLVVVDSVYDAFVEALEQSGAAVLSPEEGDKFLSAVLVEGKPVLRRKFIGRAAAEMAEAAGIIRDQPIRLIVVPTEGVSQENAMSREKMGPVLGMFRVPDEEEGMEICEELLDLEGAGHTAAIHSADPELLKRFAERMPAGRIIANSPATQGVVGLTTGLVPSLTLGCGTFGGNSTADNVTYTHVMNVKRLAEFRPPKIEV